jgi:alcohol dehydrogenase YqhD (iron-dependent ADH family)
VKPNPTLAHAREGVAAARQSCAEVVVAVGGGSVIDEAKAIAAGALHECDVWEFYCQRAKPQRKLPLLTVLTLPATASEANGGTVLTNEVTGQKFGFMDPVLYPNVSFLDPTLTFSLPREQSVYGAVDAFSHLLEGYMTGEQGWTPVQDRYAEGLFKTILETIDRIIADGRDYDARATMMWAASLAWNGLGTAGIGAYSMPNHALGHAIGALYDLAHGATLSLVIPAWMECELESHLGRMARFGREVMGASSPNDRDAAKTGIEALRKQFSRIGAPTSFADIGIIPDVTALTGKAHELAQLWGMNDYTPERIGRVFRNCLKTDGKQTKEIKDENGVA